MGLRLQVAVIDPDRESSSLISHKVYVVLVVGMVLPARRDAICEAWRSLSQGLRYDTPSYSPWHGDMMSHCVLGPLMSAGDIG